MTSWGCCERHASLLQRVLLPALTVLASCDLPRRQVENWPHGTWQWEGKGSGGLLLIPISFFVGLRIWETEPWSARGFFLQGHLT